MNARERGEALKEMVAWLTKSALPPIVQEYVLQTVPSLTTEAATAITEELKKLGASEQGFAESIQAWRIAWERITGKIEDQLQSELRTIEEELFQELTKGLDDDNEEE